MNRREFSVEAALALLGGATIAIGCGSNGSSPAASSPPLVDLVGTVGANHNHAALITAAQLGSGGAVDLDIRGTASHPHTVALSAAEVMSIRNGMQVQKESSGNSHTHTVTFNA